MSNKVKDIDIKNRTYYFCNDIINIKIFNPNSIKIDEKSYKIFFFFLPDWIWNNQIFQIRKN